MRKIQSIVLIPLILSLGFFVACSCAQEDTYGWVSVSSTPLGAKLLIDGKQVGYTPVDQYRLHTGSYMYTLILDGYTPVQRTFSVKAGETTSLTVKLAPLSQTTTRTTLTTRPTTVTTRPTTPIPSAGSIYASTSPSGASIYVNGIFEGYSPLLIPDLAPRTYTVRAHLDGYHDYAGSVRVNSNQRSEFYANLQKTPIHKDHGYISVSSSPSGAQLYVDGTYRGTTPATVTEYPGSHPVVLKLSGYHDYSQTVSVTAGATNYISTVLSPVTRSGYIKIYSQPGDANIYLDGTYRGQTDSYGNLIISNLPAGTYQVKATKPQYSDAVYPVLVTQGQESYVQVYLAPISPTITPTSPPEQSGSLSVTSTPAGAQVFIDNTFRGYTPSTYDNLVVGMHALSLKLSGYHDYSTNVQINQGSTATVNAALSPEPTPTRGGMLPATGLLALLCIAYGLCRRENS